MTAPEIGNVGPLPRGSSGPAELLALPLPTPEDTQLGRGQPGWPLPMLPSFSMGPVAAILDHLCASVQQKTFQACHPPTPATPNLWHRQKLCAEECELHTGRSSKVSLTSCEESRWGEGSFFNSQ